ncbi:MAG TPA: PilZ domain-containing protein [Terriglobales bacterium]
MQSASPPAAGNVSSAIRPYRHLICTLAYVRLDHANGGIIRNLNETGMAIQAVGRLHPEQVVHLRFEFIRPRAKFELVGQVAWADAKGQAGLHFTDVPTRTRRLLKDWMLTDLLAAATELSGPVLKTADLEDGLVMSHRRLPSIRLAAPEAVLTPTELAHEVLAHADQVSVPWWPTRIHQRSLARFIDGMVVISAVLLFSIIVAELTDVVPSWPMLASAETALTLGFALLYYYLCKFLMRITLGTQLAQIAANDISENIVSSASEPY